MTGKQPSDAPSASASPKQVSPREETAGFSVEGSCKGSGYQRVPMHVELTTLSEDYMRPMARLRWFVRRKLGVSVSEAVAISLVYMVQGVLLTASLATDFFFKDELKVNPSQLQTLLTLSHFPWTIKPLYGMISDTIPLFGYKRRSYLAIAGVTAAASWTGLALFARTALGTVVALSSGWLSIAFSDVVADSIVVERSRGQPKAITGSLQSLCWTVRYGASVIAAKVGSYVVQEYGSRMAFGVFALFPLLVSVAAVLVDEPRVQLPVRGGRMCGVFVQLWHQLVALWNVLRRRAVLGPSAFIFLWNASPSYSAAMFYFYTNHLNFSPQFLGNIQVVAFVASMAGVLLYNSCLKGVRLRVIIIGIALVSTAISLTQLILVTGLNEKLGLSNEMFALADKAVLRVMSELAAMPMMVLVARICPEGVEATLFAAVMSLWNLGSAIGDFLGSLLTKVLGINATNFDHLALLVVLCSVSLLGTLPFMGLIPANVSALYDDGEEAEERLREGGEAGAPHQRGVELMALNCSDDDDDSV